jgi:hypothetical protein
MYKQIKMVLMSAGKAARYQDSIMNNNAKSYGLKMGGLTPLVGRGCFASNAIQQRAGYCGCVPYGFTSGLLYMKQRGIFQVNQASSGGVGRMFTQSGINNALG